jgi:hypothetical protein
MLTCSRFAHPEPSRVHGGGFIDTDEIIFDGTISTGPLTAGRCQASSRPLLTSFFVRYPFVRLRSSFCPGLLKRLVIARSGGQGRAFARPLGLILDGREHDGTLITAGVRVLSEVDASSLCPGWVPHRAQRGPRTPVRRLIEVTSTAVPAGTGAGRFVAGSVKAQRLVFRWFRFLPASPSRTRYRPSRCSAG